jgi:hypothetical protein
MQCTICDEILEGRELGYIPVMCEREGCPGPCERRTVVVKPAETNLVLRHGLTAICVAGDGWPFTDAYLEAGGGYEGLRAIARAALDASDRLGSQYDDSDSA